MTPEQWQQIKALFSEAVEQPPDQRVGYVRARATDDEVRREVEAMLAAHDEAPTTGPSAEPESPKYVGYYRLLQPIGEGGMGIVYLAEQEHPVRRRVALKIIKPGMDSAQVVARFEAERQALAMMDHPNIARVFDAGTTGTGRPYFVMELVQGIPITQYCDNKQFTPRERLELFIPVCQAVQHAHQQGIIHRDLKPSNVLVITYDGKPVPKVIDFGVAKALHQRLTEKTLFTQFGNVVGTLEYMSPEQTDLDVLGTDTRSDIYSLGVLLYELLTGTTPFDGKKLRAIGYEQMLKTIREEEPPKPSTRLSHSGPALASVSAQRSTEPRKLMKVVSGDLDWIVMKCLEKDRARRYETADGVSKDIQRYLSEEPVEASPPSTGYRLSKLARRYRVWLRVAASFSLVLIVATVVSGWQAVRATRAKSAAVSAEAAAVSAKREASRQRDRVIEEQKQTQLKLAEALVLGGDVSLLADRPEEALSDYYQAHDLFRQAGTGTPRADLALWALYRRYPVPLNSLGLERDLDRCLALAKGGRAIMCEVKTLPFPREAPNRLVLRDLADGHEIAGVKFILPPHGVYGNPEDAAPSRPAAVSGDLRTVLLGCLDGKVLVWDTVGGSVRELGDHHGSVLATGISADGRRGFSAGEDRVLKAWDVQTGRQVCSFTFSTQYLQGATLSPDGRTAAIYHQDPINEPRTTLLNLCDARTLIRKDCDMQGRVRFTDNGRIALLPEREKLTSFDTQAARVLQVLDAGRTESGELDSFQRVAPRPDGRTVVVVSTHATRLWDCTTGRISSIRPDENREVWSVSSPEGHWLLLGSRNGIQLDELETGRPLLKMRAFPAVDDGYAIVKGSGRDTIVSESSIEVSHTDRMNTLYEHAAVVRVWNGGPDLPYINAGAGSAHCVALSDDGELLAACGEKTLAVWDTHTGRELRRFNELQPITSVAFSPDGRSLLVGGKKESTWPQGAKDARGAVWAIEGNGTLSRWDLLDGRQVSHVELPGLLTTRDGRSYVASYGGDGKGPGTASLRDLKTNRQVYTCSISTDEVWNAANGVDRLPRDSLEFLAMTCWPGFEGLQIYGPMTRGPAAEFWNDPYFWGAWSTYRNATAVQGQTFARQWGDIYIYNAADGRRTQKLNIPGPQYYCSAIAIAPDGRYLLTAIRTDGIVGLLGFKGIQLTPEEIRQLSGPGGELWIWDVQTGKKLYSLPSRSGDICSVGFSRNGRIAAYGTDDGTIEVMDFSRGIRYRDFTVKLDQARRRIQVNQKDAMALSTFGEWYAFRDKWDWAIEYLEAARANGRDISALTLARCYLATGQTAAAHREFQRALERREGSDAAVQLCLQAP